MRCRRAKEQSDLYRGKILSTAFRTCLFTDMYRYSTLVLFETEFRRITAAAGWSWIKEDARLTIRRAYQRLPKRQLSEPWTHLHGMNNTASRTKAPGCADEALAFQHVALFFLFLA